MEMTMVLFRVYGPSCLWLAGNEGIEEKWKLLEWVIWGLLQGSRPSFLADRRKVKGLKAIVFCCFKRGLSGLPCGQSLGFWA